MSFPESLHLFCHVVDNFGDIGVCWRLARQLANEHGIRVTLWVDHLPSLKKICSALDAEQEEQRISAVTIRRWPKQFKPVEPHETADAVIEAFACELPSPYVEAMAMRAVPPVWINLEYLSAEEWVEGCHHLASPHPLLPLVKHFFFPGFTERTGGLLLERDLLEKRAAFQADAASARGFLNSLGVAGPQQALVVSLFCYPHAPVADLFDAISADSSNPVICLVPEGVASDAVGEFLQQQAKEGSSAVRGGLKVQVIPFLDQDDYDRLLWSCDLNFVRGEDSFVRAQWAARPFIWQIYPQEEGAHEAKLKAFLARYQALLKGGQADAVNGFWHAWNGLHAGASDMKASWERFRSALPEQAQIGPDWARELAANGDLAGHLVGFLRSLR